MSHLTPQQAIHNYAASAARNKWITQSRYRELTGHTTQQARTHINTAPQWPAQYKQQLTNLLDTLNPNTPPHILESKLTGYRLQPITIQHTQNGHWTITAHQVGGPHQLATLHHPNDTLIQAVLTHWHIETPPHAWHNPALTINAKEQ